MKYVAHTRTVDPQTVIITCQGEMDTLAVQELHQAVDPLLSDSASHFVFDLGAVEYVSSSVLSFLMATQGKAQEKGGKVSLVGASELVRQVFEMASLDGLFGFYRRLEDLGIVQPSATPKGKEKVPKKEKKAPAKEAERSPGTTAGPTGAESSERVRVGAVDGKEQGRTKGVEKIQPVGERRSWRDYGAWLGIAAVASVSLLVSLYFYLTR